MFAWPPTPRMIRNQPPMSPPRPMRPSRRPMRQPRPFTQPPTDAPTADRCGCGGFAARGRGSVGTRVVERSARSPVRPRDQRPAAWLYRALRVHGVGPQKGGLVRALTLLKQIGNTAGRVSHGCRKPGPSLGPSGGDQIPTTVKGLAAMDYQAIGFGPDDLRLGASELLSVAATEDDNPFASSNVELLAPDLVPLVQRVEAGGKTIGITTALDPARSTPRSTRRSSSVN